MNYTYILFESIKNKSVWYMNYRKKSKRKNCKPILGNFSPFVKGKNTVRLLNSVIGRDRKEKINLDFSIGFESEFIFMRAMANGDEGIILRHIPAYWSNWLDHGSYYTNIGTDGCSSTGEYRSPIYWIDQFLFTKLPAIHFLFSLIMAQISMKRSSVFGSFIYNFPNNAEIPCGVHLHINKNFLINLRFAETLYTYDFYNFLEPLINASKDKFDSRTMFSDYGYVDDYRVHEHTIEFRGFESFIHPDIENFNVFQKGIRFALALASSVNYPKFNDEDYQDRIRRKLRIEMISPWYWSFKKSNLFDYRVLKDSIKYNFRDEDEKDEFSVLTKRLGLIKFVRATEIQDGFNIAAELIRKCFREDDFVESSMIHNYYMSSRTLWNYKPIVDLFHGKDPSTKEISKAVEDSIERFYLIEIGNRVIGVIGYYLAHNAITFMYVKPQYAKYYHYLARLFGLAFRHYYIKSYDLKLLPTILLFKDTYKICTFDFDCLIL